MATYIISKRNFLEFHYAAVSVRQNRVLNAVVERNDSRVAAELVKIVGDDSSLSVPAQPLAVVKCSLREAYLVARPTRRIHVAIRFPEINESTGFPGSKSRRRKYEDSRLQCRPNGNGTGGVRDPGEAEGRRVAAVKKRRERSFNNQTH